MKKKILLSFMLMCISVFAFGMLNVSAYTGTQYGDYLYYKESNGEIQITDYDETATVIDIPETIDGKKVTSIGYEAFYGCSKLTCVTIPDSVTEINKKAFYNCSSLTEVHLGKGIKSIGEQAFDGCRIEKLYVSDIESYLNCDYSYSSNPMEYSPALYINGKRQTKIEIPNGVTKIPDYAFYGCSGLTSITFPESVTSIGNYAFNSCSGLTEVTFPKKLTTIGYYVFSNCTGLKNITIPDSVTSIGSSMFYKCSNLTNVTIGNGLKEIPYEMFRHCKKLENVEIGSNITIIGEYAFDQCSNLESIVIPDSVVEIGGSAFNYSGLESVTIGNGVTKIGSEAFQCFSLKTINIPNMKMWCNIEFDDDVFIDSWYGNANPLYNYSATLYINGEKIENLIIPDGITSINKIAFYGGSQFKSVSIPKSVTEIEKNAFSGCDNISSVYYGGTDTDWEEMYIDSGNDALTNATRKSIYYITLIDDDGNTSSITCLPNEKIKLSDIEKKYMHKVTLYTDEKMTKEFDTTTAITDNMTLYVKLGEEITVIYGDIDDDGEITMNDAIYLFNAAMFPDQYSIPSGQKTDYNGDGTFDMNDAIYLFNHAMFPEQYPI